MLLRRTVTGLFSVVLTLSLINQGWTDEPSKANEGALVDALGTAAQLIAFGRGELSEVTGLAGRKCPEAIVAAGGIYLRAHKLTGSKSTSQGMTVSDDTGNEIAAEGSQSSFAAEAEALFDEARAMVTKDDAEKIEAQIKELSNQEVRGAAGGPRTISRTIQSGKTHNIKIEFEGNAPATVAMRSSGGTQFEVIGAGGKKLWHSQGSWGTYTWNTRGKGDRTVTVKVINKGGPPVSYSVVTN